MVPGAKRPPPIASELVNTGLLLEDDTRGRGEGALAVRGFGVAPDGDDGFRVWPGGIVSSFPSSSCSSPTNTSLGSMPRGGLAVFRILLLPRNRSVEGIRLSFEDNQNEFSEEVGGRVRFLSTPPEVSGPTGTTSQDAPPDAAGPPKN